MVQFYLNNNQLLAQETDSPYVVRFDTTEVKNGTHVLTAVATDSKKG